MRSLHARHHVQVIRYDPYQLHRSMTGLRTEGLPCEEYPQTTGHCTAMGQCLFDLLTGHNLRLYPSAELREQALNTVSIEHARGWRIAKDKSSKKIDAIVALAMACVAAIAHGNVTAAGISPEQDPEIREAWRAQEAAAPHKRGDLSTWTPLWGRSLRHPSRFWR